MGIKIAFQRVNSILKTPDLTNNNVNKMKRQKSQCITSKEVVESTNALYHSTYIQSCIRDLSIVDSGLTHKKFKTQLNFSLTFTFNQLFHLYTSDRPNVRFGRNSTVRFGQNDELFFSYFIHSMLMASSFKIFVLPYSIHVYVIIVFFR